MTLNIKFIKIWIWFDLIKENKYVMNTIFICILMMFYKKCFENFLSSVFYYYFFLSVYGAFIFNSSMVIYNRAYISKDNSN